MKKSKDIFVEIYKNISRDGKLIAPRGMTVLEEENGSYNIPPYVRFTNFKSRKLNLDYIKREFLWYLKGDRHDVSIAQYAKIWQMVVNDDGSFNSNYGQYFFGEQNQFDTVVKILREDKDSRRASVLLLTKEHVNSDTKDVPCTYSVNFRIRDNKLNMTVRMRSQDAVFGLGNDLPTFSFIHEMMYNALLEFYPELEYGNYHHSSDSLHIYERHFEMVATIIADDEYTEVECPKMSGPDEVRFLRNCNFENIPEEYKFTKWLTTIK